MKTALRTRLTADATISGLVGGRVDWGLRPQGKALPAISLTLISTPHDYRMDGPQTTRQFRVQADCWANSYKSSQDVRDAVIAALEPASGSFQQGFVERDFDAPERTEAGEIHRAVLEFKLTYISA